MSLTSSVVTMLGAVVLLCAFLQISRRRLVAMLKLNQIASLALGGAALWQGFAQQAWSFYALGVLILVVQAVALPRVLRRMMSLFHVSTEAGHALPVAWSLLVGLLPVILAGLATVPATNLSLPSASGGVAIALAILLLGVWLMVVHVQPFGQIIGFITLENGLVLGLINVHGLGWAVDIAMVTLLGMQACLILLAYWRHSGPEEIKTGGADL